MKTSGHGKRLLAFIVGALLPAISTAFARNDSISSRMRSPASRVEPALLAVRRDARGYAAAYASVAGSPAAIPSQNFRCGPDNARACLAGCRVVLEAAAGALPRFTLVVATPARKPADFPSRGSSTAFWWTFPAPAPGRWRGIPRSAGSSVKKTSAICMSARHGCCETRCLTSRRIDCSPRCAWWSRSNRNSTTILRPPRPARRRRP